MRAKCCKLTGWLALGSLLTFAADQAGAAPPAKQKPGADFSDLADDVLADLGAAWWNKQWSYRRRLTLVGPGLANLPDRVAFFQDPDPLLLFNTGRCQDHFSDLRIVTGNGTVLPVGVIRFGRDDGTCWLWCLLPETRYRDLYLYYGNPDAKPQQAAGPARLVPPQEQTIVAHLGAEETAEGARPPNPPAADWLRRVVAVEAESFIAAADKTASPLIHSIDVKGASCGKLLTPVDPSQSTTVWSSVDLDSSGTWYVHVRRFLPRLGKPQPFELRVGEQEFRCGLDADESGGFQWDHFAVDLDAGPHQIGLQIAGSAAPDCLIFSRDAAYRPDYRDVSGPVWMRFKVVSEAENPCFVDWFSVHTPYSERGPLGRTTCLLFRDESALTHTDAKLLAGDPDKLIPSGQWSAWGRSQHSTNYTWFSQIQFIDGKSRSGPLQGARIAWQAATRNDEGRVYRQGVEELGASGVLQVRMPTGLDYASLGMLESFGQWSQRRFEMAESLGFHANEGPKSLVMATMADSFETPTEFEHFLKTCNWLGLNTITTYYPDQKLYADLTAKYHIPWSLTHPFYGGVALDSVASPKPEKSYLETVLAAIGEHADAHYRAAAKDHSWLSQHQRYGLMGDEIGPAISSLEIKSQPLARGLFVEYLQKQQLAPEFFGAESWDEVEPVDFIVESDIRLQRAQRRAELIARTEQDVQKLSTQELRIDEDPVADRPQAEEILSEEKKLTSPADAKRPLAAKFEKRRCHWTQKFRSDYTCEVYRLISAAAKKYAPPDFQCSVNLQAMPAQAGQMWDGALNIFDLGRRQAFDSLYTEDWTWDTYHVAFSMGLLRAAARKHQQDTGSYVVGGAPRGRIMANLSQGARTMVFYLYGPVHRIGPVWGEDRASLKELGESLRLAARCEPDLLAAKNRPADVALLVANTSEINARFLPSGFGGERIAVITALADAQMPVDIIGEEEVIEDDILTRYQALYVCDPHVDSRAQQKIKQWVASGGTLWATGFALARQEYDEPSTEFDEVFGLKERGPVEPPAQSTDPPARITAMASGLLPALEFSGSSWQPQYVLSTGEALAKFDAGGPAIVHNQFGKGQAILNAWPATCLAGHDAQLLPLATTAARIAGAKQHVRAASACPQLFTCVHDGPRQTVVFLLNDAGDRAQHVDLEVSLPAPAQSALSARNGKLEFVGRPDAAVVSVDLPPREADILVFSHAAGSGR